MIVSRKRVANGSAGILLVAVMLTLRCAPKGAVRTAPPESVTTQSAQGDVAAPSIKPTVVPTKLPVRGVGGLPLPELQPRLGAPLNGLSSEELALFAAGKKAFGRVFTPEDGLGPVHNLHSCIACHNNPVGGAGTSTIMLFGRDRDGVFDPMTEFGGPMLQTEGLHPGCVETVPSEANVTAHRLSPSLLGSGLVEAIPDDDLLASLTTQSRFSGRVNRVNALEDPPGSPPRVGRFGFKCQLSATVLTCSAVSTVAEMGLTNRFITEENAPNADVARVAPFDNVPDPELKPDERGLDYIDRITHFQRYLAAPPQTPRRGMSGEEIFQRIGCAECHTPEWSTPDRVDLEPALRGKTFKPYSDFLLHDMGENADGIAQGDAGCREMRTTPLWGFRIRFPLWHDGRVTGATLTERADRAIMLHAGEAEVTAQAYELLSSEERAALIAFLDSLGRVEFDNDGDNDVDVTDHHFFAACFTGPGQTGVTPDQRCALTDVDEDRSVSLVDFALLQRAFTGPLYGTALVVP